MRRQLEVSTFRCGLESRALDLTPWFKVSIETWGYESASSPDAPGSRHLWCASMNAPGCCRHHRERTPATGCILAGQLQSSALFEAPDLWVSDCGRSARSCSCRVAAPPPCDRLRQLAAQRVAAIDRELATHSGRASRGPLACGSTAVPMIPKGSVAVSFMSGVAAGSDSAPGLHLPRVWEHLGNRRYKTVSRRWTRV
jgi:hypothetical protein